MEKVTRTAKILLLPDKAQKRLLAETAEQYRKACVYAGEYIYKHQEIRRFYLHKKLYPELRDEHRFGLPSQMAESVIRSAAERERVLIQIHRKWVKPEFKRPVCIFVPGRDYTFREDGFSIRTLRQRIHVPCQKKGREEYFNGDFRFGSASLLEVHGKWYLHIAATREIEKPKRTDVIPCIVGCDFGVNFLLTAYDSFGKTKFFSGREVKQNRAMYKKNRNELKKRNTPSARRRIRTLAQKERNYLQNINHETAKKLVEAYPPGTMFVVERGNHGQHMKENMVISNLTKEGMKENVEINVNWSFWDLRQKIAYKAEKRGGFLLEADPLYSSQKCPRCGEIKKENRNKRAHMYRCNNCGYTSNDDRIGAINLYEKGIEYLHTVGLEHAPCQGAQPAVPRYNVYSNKKTVITSKQEDAGPNKQEQFSNIEEEELRCIIK